MAKGKKRNKDGTFRNNNKAAQVGANMIRGAWVEAETLTCKQRMGFTFEQIAEHIIRVGHGKEQPMVPLPTDIEFASDYSISDRACAAALSRALARVPNVAAEEYRQIDMARLEYLYGAAQPGVAKSSPPHILAAAKVLQDKSKLGGYAAPEKYEVGGKDGQVIKLAVDQFRQLMSQEKK